MPQASRRDHIIDVAIALFCQHGFHATGVDTIMRVAKVSKKTLYNHFRSKDELILAALKQQDGRFRNDFMKDIASRAKEPRDQLLAIFDAAEQWFNDKNFFGCMFVNVVGEYSDPASPMRAVSRNFKRMINLYILELCEKAGAKDPEKLAKEIALIFEGSIVTAQISGNAEGAKTAKQVAKHLLSLHL